MATKVPGTTWDPLSSSQTQPRMSAHDIVGLHTMAGYFENVDRDFHANGFGGLESHMGMRADGFTKQWQDLEFTADANGDGNHRIISIETEDHGPEFDAWANGSDVPEWTDAQVNKLVEIIRWCCDKYNIPKVLIPDSKPGRRGIGYHRQGIDPWRVPGGEVWSTKTGKVCPGDRRIHQLTTIIIPRVVGEEDLDKTEHDALMDIQKKSKAMFKAIRNDDDADPALVAGLREHIAVVLNSESNPTTGRGHDFRTALGDKAYDGSMKALTETGLFVPPQEPEEDTTKEQ